MLTTAYYILALESPKKIPAGQNTPFFCQNGTPLLPDKDRQTSVVNQVPHVALTLRRDIRALVEPETGEDNCHTRE